MNKAPDLVVNEPSDTSQFSIHYPVVETMLGGNNVVYLGSLSPKMYAFFPNTYNHEESGIVYSVADMSFSISVVTARNKSDLPVRYQKVEVQEGDIVILSELGENPSQRKSNLEKFKKTLLEL